VVFFLASEKFMIGLVRKSNNNNEITVSGFQGTKEIKASERS